MRYSTSVSVPTITPSSRATNTTEPGSATSSSTWAPSGGGELCDNCGTRRANASSSSSVASVAISMVTLTKRDPNGG